MIRFAVFAYLSSVVASTVVPFGTASKTPGFAPAYTTHACGPPFGTGGNASCAVVLCPFQSLVLDLCVEYTRQDTVAMLLNDANAAVAEDDDGCGIPGGPSLLKYVNTEPVKHAYNLLTVCYPASLCTKVNVTYTVHGECTGDAWKSEVDSQTLAVNIPFNTYQHNAYAYNQAFSNAVSSVYVVSPESVVVTAVQLSAAGVNSLITFNVLVEVAHSTSSEAFNTVNHELKHFFVDSTTSTTGSVATDHLLFAFTKYNFPATEAYYINEKVAGRRRLLGDVAPSRRKLLAGACNSGGCNAVWANTTNTTLYPYSSSVTLHTATAIAWYSGTSYVRNVAYCVCKVTVGCATYNEVLVTGGASDAGLHNQTWVATFYGSAAKASSYAGGLSGNFTSNVTASGTPLVTYLNAGNAGVLSGWTVTSVGMGPAADMVPPPPPSPPPPAIAPSPPNPPTYPPPNPPPSTSSDTGVSIYPGPVQYFETVTVVGIAAASWTTADADAYITAYSQTYAFVNKYFVSSYLSTTNSTYPGCTAATCTDINTVFFWFNPSDTQSGLHMFHATTVVNSASVSASALWANQVANGLVSQGATAFVRRGFSPFTTNDLGDYFHALSGEPVAFTVTCQDTTALELVTDANGPTALAAALGHWIKLSVPAFDPNQMTVSQVASLTPTSVSVVATVYDSNLTVATAAQTSLAASLSSNQSTLAAWVSTHGLSGVKNFTLAPPPPPSPPPGPPPSPPPGPPPSPPPSPPPIAYWSGGTTSRVLTLVGPSLRTWTTLESSLAKTALVNALRVVPASIHIDSQAAANLAGTTASAYSGVALTLRILAPQNSDVAVINATFTSLFQPTGFVATTASTWAGQTAPVWTYFNNAGLTGVTYIFTT